MATSFRYGSAPGDTARSRSRFSKALPVPPSAPPPSLGGEQKASPLPVEQRPLPPQPTSIPRRPVGAPATVSSHSAHSRAPSGESVSSLFSLYKDSPLFAPSPSIAPTLKNLSQTLEVKVMSPLPKNNNVPDQTSSPPPLPQKDNVRIAKEPPQPPNKLPSSSTPSADSSSKPKIWRRRSVRSDRSPSISDLKLTESNGFTSNPPVIAHPTLPAKQSLQASVTPPPPTLPQPAPRAPRIGLPGRNIRKPIPTLPNPDETAQIEPDQPEKKESMGQKLSTISRKKVGADEPGVNAITSTTRTATMSPVTRLPTPEYQQTDKKLFQPITPQVIPPSPETSPSDTVPPSPRAAALRGVTTISNPAMAISSDRPAPSPKGPSHTSSASYSSHTSEASNSSNNSTIKPTVVTKSAPSYPPRGQSLHSQSQSQSLAQLPGPIPSNPKTLEPTLSEPSASAFPFNNLTAAAPGTIFAPAQLTSVHFNCFQSHRSMRMSRNNMYPLACMVCERKDTEKRWMCTWCCLRCCEGCLKTLANAPGRDLNLTLEKINRTGSSNVAVR